MMLPEFLLIWLVFFTAKSQYIDPNKRIDCHPDPNVDLSSCQARGCLFDNSTQLASTVPRCYFPQNTGYVAQNGTGGNTVVLQKSANSVNNPFHAQTPDYSTLIFNSNEIGNGLSVAITPQGVSRFRPPVPINTMPNIVSSEKLTITKTNGSIFSFVIQRQSSGAKIWDTSIGGLLYSDKFIQIATYLPSDKIYGFGEAHHRSLKHNLTYYKTWSMFARDNYGLVFDKPLYGVHAFYMGLENDGKAHGVFAFNSAPQEVTTGPGPHLTYRTIGGQLEFYFFPGPTPEQVVQQYQQVIGRPAMPAYWALGYHICKFGYLSTSEVETVVNRTVSNGIPFDVAWVDINYANGSKDFTLNKTSFGGLPAYADYLHSQNMKLIVIVDPGIAVDYEVFERGLQQGASFIEWASSELVPNDVNGKYPLTNNTNLMLGAVWPLVHVAFPDFLDPTGNTTKWWINEFTAFHQMLPVDGIWIDMNEPSECPGCVPLSNFGYNPHLKGLKCPMTGNWSEYDNPPYLTAAVYLYPDPNVKSFLWTNTLCLNGISMRGQSNLFHTKSLYGWSMMRATHEVQREVMKKRGLLLSRSTFAGAGQFGAHWLGDGWANFSTMALSMIGVQEFNMFGIPLIGADVCGFNGDTTEELCLRWQQLGAFYPFFRNHNDVGLPPKDPGLWPTVAAAARKSNLFRYRHLPYLYSLLFNAHINGGTVARPVFFEFPNDPLTYDLSFQFMWGSAMIVVPVITQGANYSVGYLPSSATWYSLYDYFYGSKIDSGIQSEFPAPWNYMLPVFVRAGNIIPRQRPTTTTTATRQNEFQLLVALDVDNSQNLVAKGELYWDDGETLIDNITTYNYYHFEYNFSGNNNSATLNISMTRQAQNLILPTLDNIEIFGYAYSPNIATAKLNGNPVQILSSSYSPFTQVLNISSPALIDLNKNRPNWILTWNNVGVANEKDGIVGDKTGNADS